MSAETEAEYVPHYEYREDSSWSFDFKVDPAEFNAFVDAVSRVVDESKLEISSDGLSTRAVDPANCALVEDTRPDVSDLSGVGTVGVNWYALKTGLPPYHKTDDYYVTADAKDSTLRVRSPEGEAETALFDPNVVRDEPEIPDVDHGQAFALPGYRWNGAVGAIAGATDGGRVALCPENGTLTVKGSEDEWTEGWDYEWDLDVDVLDGGAGHYAADYLSKICSGLPASGEFDIRFGHNQTLYIDANGLRYWQAPRTVDGGSE